VTCSASASQPPALGYLFLISLITTGIAHTTPAVALIMVVIVSSSATRAHLPVRTADRRQVIKDRGRHVRSRVDGRILEDKPRQGTYTPALHCWAAAPTPCSQHTGGRGQGWLARLESSFITDAEPILAA
jgi:hypothetical protein